MIIADPAIRKWIYGIVTALIPILVIFGVIGPDESQAWLNLAAAVLGLGAAGLAFPNTPPPPPPPPVPANPLDRVEGPDHRANM
ncbi:hypothetical protein [Arthrobacter agilis]|uniref:hypothetical protein n=1 Tax=Arthrobacter agilis TaxID=37921 RepID=UPI0027821926|nr:hypothetical protein [Arthrobacter agilis]MDQ0735167.1 hypothetical protein [Arthrobacter agilis]